MTLTKDNVNVEAQAIEAKKASKSLMILSDKEKNDALHHIADVLERDFEAILAANEKDLRNGREQGFTEAFMDRLSLSQERIRDFAQGLRDVAELEDPTGKKLSDWTLENGLQVEKVTVPLGVIGMIYEARPNVTVDATGLALKSGNAIVLKGGSSAINSNQAIVEVIHKALAETKIPQESVQFIASTDRAATNQLFTMKEHVDVLIPRGGGKLIQAVVENATVPVLETGVGNCHIYIDKDADVEKAISILVNAKTDRPAVCNAAETLIVHKDWLAQHSDELISALKKENIHVHGDEHVLTIIPDAVPAGEDDWKNEYLSTDIAVKAVDDLVDAIAHIETYGTKHSEAIVTENQEAADKFLAIVDAAAIYHNASTRFTDGGALGFGAEIGISTQKLHARGPMGLPALTTVKFLMKGTGQIR
ncbi:gamma-glutamyl-phosphate reductase [Halobacillus halophilus]|uniref:Gamma-glutamyl phosphate reductase n=2 Tax=Halobacillus halophilus TaxID=1570 RepID=I0JJ39_HALH3|nr:glutamate-5-semialdehyde dehydrogenase [Halobacillus halophilus]ABU95603.1 glutamate-5-semialdehyde dehydrogenase [Halobacillus halophilus DSM 2266]ASF38321.1 gamma-glutamyl-phosphate reductase [Halobacillus halophilus]CCG44157.1 gamma-glutamyl phosphate reductase [Halobacillus halophilus DSM 2266]